MIVGKPQLLKNMNSDIVRDLIYQAGAISKPEIAEQTALSLPTVNKRVNLLLREGWICEAGSSSEGVGRKAKKYEANRTHNMILMLYHPGGFTGYLADITGTIHYRKNFEFENAGKGSKLTYLCQCIGELRERVRGKVLAIGVTVPGVVKKNGLLRHIPAIREWEKCNLQEELLRQFQVDIIVENDIRMTTLGYYQTCLKEKYTDAVYLYAEDGLSAGVIINGQLHRGMENFAGELGFLIFHENLRSQNEPVDGHGDFETSLMEVMLQIDRQGPRESLLGQYYGLLAKGIVTVGAVTAPEIVVIQGRYLNDRALEEVTNRIKRYFPKDVLPRLEFNTDSSYSVQGIIQVCVKNAMEKTAKTGIASSFL